MKIIVDEFKFLRGDKIIKIKAIESKGVGSEDCDKCYFENTYIGSTGCDNKPKFLECCKDLRFDNKSVYYICIPEENLKLTKKSDLQNKIEEIREIEKNKNKNKNKNKKDNKKVADVEAELFKEIYTDMKFVTSKVSLKDEILMNFFIDKITKLSKRIDELEEK